MKRFKIAAAVAALTVISLGGGETAARLLHVADIPVYRADPVLGYIPQPSQSGVFLRKNDWFFNARSFGMREKCSVGPKSILLLGDSVVLGGVWVPQNDKLGPNIAMATGSPVCPLSAGSWSIENELRAVRISPDLLNMGTIILVSNSGDFGEPSAWQSERTHPTNRPVSHLLYAANKKLNPVSEATDAVVTPAATAQWQNSLRSFLKSYKGKFVWIIYPTKNQMRVGSTAFDQAKAIVKNRGVIVDISRDPRWNVSLYRDSIHPSVEGNRVLSQIITGAL